MNNNAAVLVYTREKYIGFPSRFTIEPDDFTRNEEAALLKYIHNAMDSVIELRSVHKQSKVIIANDKHIILGIVSYLRDMADDGWEGKDRGSRLIYGFFGFVWKKEEFEPHSEFPCMKNFSRILESLIRPHWEDSENCRWADMPHFSKYDNAVEFPEKNRSVRGEYSPGRYSNKTVIMPSGDEDELVLWGMRNINKVPRLSLCTNVCVYSENSFSSSYQYVSRLNEAKADKKAPVQKRETSGTNRIKPEQKKETSGTDRIKPERVKLEPVKKKSNEINTNYYDKPVNNDVTYQKNKPSSPLAVYLILAVVGVAVGVVLSVLFFNVGWLYALAVFLVLIVVISAIIIVLKAVGKKPDVTDNQKVGRRQEPNKEEPKISIDITQGDSHRFDNDSDKSVKTEKKSNRYGEISKETTEDIFNL